MRVETLALAILGLTTMVKSNVIAADVDPALEQAIRDKAAETLLDPYSAVFTFNVIKEFESGMAGKICGSVNAKNRFGAYTGQRFFYAGYVRIQDGYMAIVFKAVDMSFERVMAHGDICS